MWKTVTLGDYLTVQNGYAFNSKKFGTDGGIGLIRIRDLKQGVSTETRYDGDYDSKFVVERGDLLIGMDGEFRCYEWKGEDALLNQRVCRLQDFDDNLDKRFLLYAINSELKRIEDVTGFTTVKHLSSKTIKEIKFRLPPLAEQQRIVAKLDAAFAEIDRAVDATEEQLSNAPSVFSQYLSKISAHSVPLGEIVNIKTGKLNANAMEEDGIYPFFTCSREAYRINSFAFDCDAVLLAGNNAAGEFNVKHYMGKFNAYQRTYVLTVRDERALRSRYLYYQLINALKKFKRMSVGSGTKFLKLGMIQGLHIPFPSLEEQDLVLEKLEALQSGTGTMTDVLSDKLNSLSILKSAILAQELQPPQSEAA